ncbi:MULTISPECIES: hypothetical protein [unclassified Cyanobium]|uniref:hypothetical protein n=1 Tax=unclassified Cyanobium TaxID=2627006 RepID=UPI0020CD1EF4|nr:MULTISPECIES: hypothetical protein [unclassified Cyanobium]
MATASAQSFEPPAIPWRQPQQLSPLLDLGPGLDPEVCRLALSRLCADTELMAVLASARGPGARRAPIPTLTWR